MPTDEAHRARAWARSTQEAVADSIEDWEHGWIARTPSYPRYFDLSLVHVVTDPGFTADELVQFADRALDGFEHRRVGFESIDAGERVRPGLEALGWKATRLVWMRHEGPAPPGGGPLVERVPYDAAHDLRVAWTYEDFPTLDPTGYFEQARAVSEARGVEVFAAQDDGVPVAYAELERVGDSAEVASVYVHRTTAAGDSARRSPRRPSRRARMRATCGSWPTPTAGRARSTNGSASARSGRCSTSSASRRE